MQSKRPRFNPLILALALAAVLMVWSVLGGTGSASSSSMEYSTVVHYFESLQVTQFSLDLNTGVITMNLKEGGKNNLPLPDTTSQSTTQATGGLLSGMLSSSDEDTAAQKNSDGTVTVRYKLPYASMFVKYVATTLPPTMPQTRMLPWCTIIPLSRKTSHGWRSCSIWQCWAAPASCCSP